METTKMLIQTMDSNLGIVEWTFKYTYDEVSKINRKDKSQQTILVYLKTEAWIL